MMKFRFFIVTFIIVFEIVGNAQISLKIEYNKTNNCNSFCNRVDIHAKNDSKNRIYFANVSIIINNEKFTNRKRASNYIRKNFMEYNDTLYCNCKYHKKKLPPDFIKEVTRKELMVFNKHNDIDRRYDSILINDIKNWIDIKYNSKLHFLEPNEECLIDWAYIDYRIPQNEVFNIFASVVNEDMKREKYLNTKRPISSDVEYYHGFFEKVAGYKFFEGKAKSNTLVIKNGKVIKNKPAPK